MCVDCPAALLIPALLARAFDTPVDVVFHLASIPGGAAELNYELGRQVNVDATTRLLEVVARQATGSAKPAVFVFASSIAVLGSPLPARVDDSTPLQPKLTYGAQKLIGEILLGDFSRRVVGGCALRTSSGDRRAPTAAHRTVVSIPERHHS